MQSYFQHHARMRSHVESGDHAVFEERESDVTFVVEWTTRFLYFMVLLNDDKKLNQSPTWKKRFYETDHEDIVKHLNDRGVSVFAVSFLLHCVLTHLHVFSKKAGLTEPEVKMFSTLHFDGKKALKECTLWLLTLGQDGNVSHYSDASSGTGKLYSYHGSKEAACIVSVPGIDISQLDPKNQEVLCFAHSFLKDQFSNRKLAHAHELTFPAGTYGRKPTNFLVDPLFLSGWPKPKSNSWFEDEVKEDSREIVGV
jgi:hypothetical protein